MKSALSYHWVKGQACLNSTVGMSSCWHTKQLKIVCVTWSCDQLPLMCPFRIALGVESECFSTLIESGYKVCICAAGNCLWIQFPTETPIMNFAHPNEYDCQAWSAFIRDAANSFDGAGSTNTRWMLQQVQVK